MAIFSNAVSGESMGHTMVAELEKLAKTTTTDSDAFRQLVRTSYYLFACATKKPEERAWLLKFLMDRVGEHSYLRELKNCGLWSPESLPQKSLAGPPPSHPGTEAIDPDTIAVRDFMSFEFPPKIDLRMTCGEALRLAEETKIKYFLVFDSQDHFAGIVTAKDLARASTDSFVEGAMKTPVLCVLSGTSLKQVVTLMEQEGVGCLPVLENNFVVGMMTRDRLRQLGFEVRQKR